MARLVWDQEGQKLYETGTSHGVLYPMLKEGGYGEGVAWNGLIAVKQSPEGGEPTELYANDKVYVSMVSAEKFKGSIEAYTYPDEFMECDGSKELTPGVFAGQQGRKPFGLSYMTILGNDTEGVLYGEKIHIIYGASVSPSAREYTTINDTPSAISFTWNFTATPAEVSEEVAALGVKPTAYVSIDLTKLEESVVKELKDMLWGGSESAKLPTIDELLAVVNKGSEETGE